jgi:hypothetical protein
VRAIWKLTSGEVLSIKAMRKMYYVQKNNIFIQLLKVVATGIEAFVLLEISFLVPMSKKFST